MSHGGEHDGEPVPGLPERLPEAESLLWQGAPDFRVFVRRVFRVPLLALYLLAMVTVQAVWMLRQGAGPWELAAATLTFGSVAAAALGVMVLMAWLIARSTLYTVTTRRLVMRIGVALPMTINIPFSKIDGATLKTWRDGSGEVFVRLAPKERVSYAVLWPHVRTLSLFHAQPSLRGLPNASRVARIVADAMVASADPAEVARPAQAAAEDHALAKTASPRVARA